MPPNPERLHIIVEPPCGGVGGAASQLQRYGTIHAGTYELWPALTISTIIRGNWCGLGSLERNKISELSGTKPDFLTQFITKLEKRWVVSDMVCFF